ncbi:peptide/nickel transport system permease protein [Constrictibacter sp. MBR-5]|jgi:peptide/nickel transport system permease protein|uniref:ABC transporter permease n=1 Tax=Constrictibacter sp. MBR-5 TaxID=3156467 RepID=UPI003395A55C
MQFLTLIGRRIAWGLGLLVAVLVLNFTLIHIAPGDPADVIAGEMGGATQESLAQIRAAYGLDRPFLEQLGVYVARVAQGDLGYSFYFNRPVTDLILERLWPTILLVVTSLLFAVFLGTFLGVYAAKRPSGIVSHLVTVLALVGYALPVFWTGIMLLILFASWIPLFPVSGMYDISGPREGLTYVLDVLHHLVLPVVTLSTIYLAIYSRLARASMLDVLGADYIRTARAKGLRQGKVIYKHALRNAVLPVVTYAGLQFSHLLSGAVLVETVFSWPGLGTLAFDSLLRRDSPTLLGILFFSALIVIVVNLLTDLSYRLIDPRIRSGARA